MVTESDPSFITQLHDTLLPIQKWMYEWAKGLTMLWGRGLFYVFQGPQSKGVAHNTESVGDTVDG